MAEAKSSGRPCEFTSEVGKAICDKLVEGLSMVEICKADSMPSRSSVHNWLLKGEADQKANVESQFAAFLDNYVRAREIQADTLIDEIIEVADDARNDWMERIGRDGEHLGYVVNGEAVARSKLRAEVRFRLAERLFPKKYGAKLDLTSKGNELKAATVVVATNADKDLLDQI